MSEMAFRLLAGTFSFTRMLANFDINSAHNSGLDMSLTNFRDIPLHRDCPGSGNFRDPRYYSELSLAIKRESTGFCSTLSARVRDPGASWSGGSRSQERRLPRNPSGASGGKCIRIPKRLPSSLPRTAQQISILDVSHMTCAIPPKLPRMPTVHPRVVIAVGILVGLLLWLCTRHSVVALAVVEQAVGISHAVKFPPFLGVSHQPFEQPTVPGYAAVVEGQSVPKICAGLETIARGSPAVVRPQSIVTARAAMVVNRSTVIASAASSSKVSAEHCSPAMIWATTRA